MEVARAGAAQPSDMKAPRKGKVGLIVLLTLIALILIFIGLTVFNVFGLRDNMLYPLLRNVPVVGNIVPDAVYGDADASTTTAISEFEAETYTLTAENASLEAQLENLTLMMEQLQLENFRLAEFEAMHEEFLSDRETLYRNLAMENPDAFIIFFETMHPMLAEQLFENLTRVQVDEERWQNYLASWSNMNPIQVANVIDSMHTTDMRLIVEVMMALPEPFRGNVLNSLMPDVAAAVLRQAEPRPEGQ